jgi:hypothetical protein
MLLRHSLGTNSDSGTRAYASRRRGIWLSHKAFTLAPHLSGIVEGVLAVLQDVIPAVTTTTAKPMGQAVVAFPDAVAAANLSRANDLVYSPRRLEAKIYLISHLYLAGWSEGGAAR